MSSGASSYAFISCACSSAEADVPERVVSRVFDVFCNGAALIRKLDMLEAAGYGQAFTRTFHGLRPNAQGKWILSFVPDVNYASVNAVEVEEETP